MADFQAPRSIGGECVCQGCCETIWSSTYDCDSMTWSAPTHSLPSFLIGGACPPDVPWEYTVGCDAVYIKYTALPQLCDECPEDPTPPPTPALDPPEGCCVDCCCLWVFGATFNCDTGTWTVTPPPFGTKVPGPCPPDGDWIYVEDCSAERYMYTTGAPPCEPGDLCESGMPDPGEPGFYPYYCCDTCCIRVWTSEYDCDSETWGTVTLYTQTAGQPCEEDQDWSVPGDFGPCTAVYVQYIVPDDCESTPVPPSPPGLMPPESCCFDPCTDCGIPQSGITVTGPPPTVCADPRNTFANTGFSGSEPCIWVFTNGAAETVNVSYYASTNTWVIEIYYFGFLGWSSAQPGGSASFTCTDGVLTGGGTCPPINPVCPTFTVTM